MKKFCSFLTAILCLTLVFSCAAAEEEKVLNIFTWEGYFDETTLNQFTDETGIAVNYSVFASNEEMLLKLQQSNQGDYDLILASDYAISTLRKEDMLLPLDKTLLTNWDNLNPDYLNQYFDPDNVYSVPYTVGVPVIVYDPSQVERAPQTFADLWDAEFEDGLWIVDDARVMIGETLKMLGYSYNTTDEAALEEAYQHLCELKKNVRVLNYDFDYYLASGEVKAAYVFTPYAVLNMMENTDLKCVFPAEGVGFGIDSIAIPANAQHPDSAHAFINFYLRDDIAKFVAEWQGYINPNAAADPLIDPDYAAMECFHIPEELFASKEYVEDLGEGESLFQDVWTNFKLYDE